MKKKSVILSIILIISLIAAAALVLLRGNFLMGEIGDKAGPTVSVTASPQPTPTPTPAPTPTPTPTPTPEPEHFVISMVGDCTLASSQHHKGASYSFEAVMGGDYAYPFAKTKQYFEDDYLSIANMEGCFTTAQTSNGGTFVFKSDPEYAQVFVEGSIEMAVLGNNHSNDFLAQGQADTQSALDTVGVAWAADNDWAIYERDDGLRVGVYSKLYPTAAQVVAGVEALKAEGCELIIAALHWGVEGTYRPTADQQNVGRAAIDAGAHIVYGSHPHVLQRTEEYSGGYILYSLGNFSFGGNTNPRDKDTAIARVTVMRDIDGSISLTGLELIPCSLSGSEGSNNYQPVPYEEGTSEYERAMSKLDGTFTGPDLSIDYSAFHSPSPEPETPTESTAPEAPVEPAPEAPAEPAPEVPAPETPVE